MPNLIVRYVGAKPQEVDLVAGTGLVWVGFGSVQTVPAKAWQVMANHPDVWELVGEAPPGLVDAKTPDRSAEVAALKARVTELEAEVAALRAPVRVDTPEPAPEPKTVAQLREYAAARGIKIDGRIKTVEAIQAAIDAATVAA